MNNFVTEFWTNKESFIITAVDKLIDELLPEKRGWNIYSLLNYLDIVYRSVMKTQKKESLNGQRKRKNNTTNTNSCNKYFIIMREYQIFNTGLINKNNEKIYFAIKGDDNEREYSYEEKYFYTGKELKDKLGNNFMGVNSIVEMLRNSYIEIIKDFENIDIISNTEEICNDCYQEIKRKINKIKNENNEELKKIKKELTNKDYHSGTGWKHIIIDGSDNLPLPIINSVFGVSYSYIDKGNIRYQIIKKDEQYICIKKILINALERSLLIAKRDITLIAPTLYPSKEEDSELKISYLIPLYLMRSDKPDCVFLFNKENGKYVGKTLLNMEEASLNIRAFGNPEQYSWLRE